MSIFVGFIVHSYISSFTADECGEIGDEISLLSGLTEGMTQSQHFVLLGDVGFVGAMGLRYRMTFIDEVNPDAVQKRSESCPPVLRPNHNFQDFLSRTFFF